MNKTNNYVSKIGSKGRAAIAILVIVLLIAGSVTAGAFIGMTAQKNKGVETKNDVQASDGLQIGILEQKQMILSTTSTISESGESQETITATITPADAYNKEIEWSIAWKTDSGWASGKDINQYITVATSGNGVTSPNTAVVTCKQAFGVQAILTATSKVQPDVYATCTVDYTERITSINVKKALTVSNGTLNQFILTSSGWGISGAGDSGFKVDISSAITKTIGTLYSNISVSKIEVKISESAGWAFYDAHLTYASDYVPIYAQGATYPLAPQMKSIFGFSKDEIQSSSAQFAINQLLNNSALNDNVFTVRITLSNGVSGEAHYGLTIEDSALLQPTNVSLSMDSIVF